MKASHVFALFVGLLIIGAADAVMSAGSLPATFDLDSRSGVIRSAIPAYLGEQGIAREVQIAFGLGEKTTEGWTTIHDTAAQIVAPSLSPGETRSLGPLHFVIAGIKGIPMRDR